MTIVSIKSGTSGEAVRQGILRIELSDGSLFSYKDCYLPSPFTTDNYAIGSEINAAEEEAFRFASACLRTEKRALQLIARAEQNVFGLSRKLQKRGHDPDCIRAVISWLCESGLLDDRRYARLWLESRISRQATSPRRLLAALRSRGIDRHDAEAALKETLDDDAERQLLERYVQKLQRKGASANSVLDPADARALRYTLKSEGFSPLSIQCLFDHYPDTTRPEF
jgi:regulatory protein